MKSWYDISVRFPSRPTDDTETTRLASRRGNGSRSTPFTMLKTAVVAPMASERVPMTIAVKPGVRISLRAE